MEKKYYVYAHINPLKNEIFYIGKGNGKRAYSDKRRSDFWYSIKNKYGFIVDILEEGLTEAEALEKEIFYINFIGRRDLGKGPLVNMTDGGEGGNGRIMTPEERENVRKRMTGENNSMYGKTPWNKGKSPSEETKEKLRIANTGWKHTEEQRAKMLANRKTFKHTPEMIERIRIANIGKKRSDEVKKRMSISRKGNNKKYFTEEEKRIARNLATKKYKDKIKNLKK